MAYPATISVKTKIALMMTVILWSSAFVGIRAGLKDYSPGALALLRYIVASIFIGWIYWRTSYRHITTIQKKDLLLLVILVGILGLAVYNITLNQGELTVPSGAASFIVSQSPIITMIVAILFLGERVNVWMILGMMISFAGVTLISMGHTTGFKFDVNMLYILLATLINALYSVIQKPFLRKYHAIPVTAFVIWGATLALSIYLPTLWQEMFVASWHATGAVIYLGVFPGAVAYVLWNYALTEIPASRAVSFLYFMPVFATILGWIWLKEVPTSISLVGGLIALMGVWLVNWGYREIV